MNYSATPVISVVITTRNRTPLVLRAVRSALAQTLGRIEVLVVVNGPDPETIEALANIMDGRLCTITLPISVGSSEARNIGIQRACGKFVAFLDDEDEWLPQKLSKQLMMAQSSTHRYPVITSRLIVRRPEADEVWPSRMMRTGESMSEYLFCREKPIRQGEGFIEPSTLLVPRELMLEVPFRSALQHHQDWDWLIRADAFHGVKIIFIWDELVICHVDGQLSADGSADSAAAWINGNELVTARARAYFYATQVATRCNSLSSFLKIVRRTIRYPTAFLIAMNFALTPRSQIPQFKH
jgi:glycosyltransferase involved in cell wall biosynthesis